MSHPIFVNLSQLVTETQAGLEWFPFAEQAINTIYLLSESPDSVCEKLLHSAVVRAFGSLDGEQMDVDAEETVPALELAKLCFLVGHVAIKQTVHLEQIESEWKKRRAVGIS